MPNFEIIGQSRETGRKRKRVFSARSEEEARVKANAEGLDVTSVQRLAEEPPTERQLAYAKDLGINIPEDSSKDDVSGLISIRVERDKPAEDRHRGFAEAYEVELPRFIGKKALFDRILEVLKQPGREADLIAWFIYRIYRGLVKGQNDGPIDGPNHPLIQDIAHTLATDESVVKSIRRYQGRDLIWFGEWTAPEGFVHTGGSNQTLAYKHCSTLLSQRLGVGHPDGSPRPRTPSVTASARRPLAFDPQSDRQTLAVVYNPKQDRFLTRNRGCLEIVFWLFLGIIVFAGLRSWIGG